MIDVDDGHEDKVRTFLTALEGIPDHDRVLSLLADDVRYHVSAWKEAVVGPTAVRAELERQASIFSDFHADIVNAVASDRLVITERVDSFKIAGKPITLHWLGVFEFDADDKISGIRDYYDMQELESQLS